MIVQIGIWQQPWTFTHGYDGSSCKDHKFFITPFIIVWVVLGPLPWIKRKKVVLNMCVEPCETQKVYFLYIQWSMWNKRLFFCMLWNNRIIIKYYVNIENILKIYS
jgi:hypothetical protein